MKTRTLIVSAVLAACSASAMAEGYLECTRAAPEFNVGQICVWRDGPPPTVQPQPVQPATPAAPSNSLKRAKKYADHGDKRTLHQAQAYADAGDARALDAANQHSAAQVAGLRIEAFAGIASAAALVPMEPHGPGKSTLNVGVASYGGQTAIGLSFARQFNGMTLNAGASKSNNGRTLTRVGFGWNF